MSTTLRRGGADRDRVGDPPHDLPIVAIVCSAGGLEALNTVIGGLPADFRAAVIVLQHHRPDIPSRLAPLLGRSSKLPVHAATNLSPLWAGEVLVVPSGKHALVTSDDRVALVSSDGTPPYRPSADLLLTSLAVVAARRTIAVVLSGYGHDGATGACAVHDLGGTVIACDEESSEHFAMPGAAIARDHSVDYVIPLRDISRMLVDLVDERDRRARTRTG